VGWVKEISKLNYEVLNTMVLSCNFVKTNYNESNATIKQHEYGFTLVNFGSLIPISDLSFAFPLHVKQVFFSSFNFKERGWKGSSKRFLWEMNNRKHSS
jgi:hypothetical protein